MSEMVDAADSLFKLGDFVAHSGATRPWKVECDALSDGSWDCLAAMVAEQLDFRAVFAIPEGGDKISVRLFPFCKPESDTILIVDDVLTTGNSFEKARLLLPDLDGLGDVNRSMIRGVAIFALVKPPGWVDAMFRLWGR